MHMTFLKVTRLYDEIDYFKVKYMYVNNCTLINNSCTYHQYGMKMIQDAARTMHEICQSREK